MSDVRIVECSRGNFEIEARTTSDRQVAHFHGGPLGGTSVNWIGGDLLAEGQFSVHLRSERSRHWDGRYVQDQRSAGGRCWDWVAD